MSPTVTIYEKATGDARLIYRATLTDFLETGDWTVEKPSGSKPSPELKKSLLPTAGRVANRPSSEEVKADVELKHEAREAGEEIVEAPGSAKRAPRRRKADDATPSSLED
jgi:hypothetical protein